jgi:VCBS repeat-containing protein
LVSLLTQYQNQAGNVNLQIETFGLSAATNGITYSSNGAANHTLQDAINYVNGFTNSSLSSGTNYDAAIGGSHADTKVAGSAYNIVSNWPASSSSVSNTVYFISDGLPQSGNGTGANAGAAYLISGQQQTDWDNLLASKGATAYAIGIDLGNNPTTYLQQVADPNDSTHVITTGSVNLGTVLTSISPVTSTVSGNVLYNDKDGGDGYHTANPILSFTHFGHTYDLTAVVGQFGVQSLTGHDMVIQTHDGGLLDINFDTGAYTYTAPSTPTEETETFTYTIADALGGDTSTATLTINVAGSGPAAYDNIDQALVTTTTVHGTPTTVTLADFSNTSNTTSSGSNYNGWIFDTKDDSGVSGDERSVTAVTSNTLANLLAVADNHWGVHNANGSTSVPGDVTVTGGHLQIIDGNDDDAGGTQAVTPVFTVSGTNTAIVSFDVGRSGSNNGDSTTWTVEERVGGSWTQVQTGSITGTATVTSNALAAGDYRVVFSVTDGSNSGNNLTVTVDNIKLTTTPADTQQTTITPATGNVLTDPMNNPNSLDTWNGADIVAGAALAIFNGLTFVDAAVAGTTVTGNYGTLDIHSDGSYTYQPTNAASAGHTDTFTYQLHQADGGVDTATLTVSTGTAGLAATQVHQGDGTITAVTGDQVIMGHGGADTLDAHGLSTGVHLEGGAGNDHLIGGAGNDFLIGGDGNDTMEGHGGFNQYAGGTGNDTIIIDPTSTDLSSASRHIDGGSGYDTLDLSKLATADLTGAAHTGITSIEAISLTGGSGTAVTLDAQSVLDISSNHTLVISGDSNDAVNLKGTTWTAGETQIANGGHTYDAYTATAGGNTSTVLVEHDTNVQVHLNTV